MAHGLDETDINMIESGEVSWEIYGNDLLLFHCEGGHRHECTLTSDQVDALLNAYRFESRKMDGKSDSVVFSPGEIDDWAGVAPDSDWEKYVEGYACAANALCHRIPKDFIEPYLFICRHTLELILKAIIMLGQEDMDLTPDLPGHHNLEKLWTSAFPIMRIHDKCTGDEVSLVRTVVREYHRADLGSFNFRYPVSKDNRKISHEEALHAFSLESHNLQFNNAVTSLSKVIKNLKMRLILKGIDLVAAQQANPEGRPKGRP